MKKVASLILVCMLALTLVFLWSFSKAKSTAGKISALFFMALAIYATAYIFFNFNELQEEIEKRIQPSS